MTKPPRCGPGRSRRHAAGPMRFAASSHSHSLRPSDSVAVHGPVVGKGGSTWMDTARSSIRRSSRLCALAARHEPGPSRWTSAGLGRLAGYHDPQSNDGQAYTNEHEDAAGGAAQLCARSDLTLGSTVGHRLGDTSVRSEED